MSHRRIISVSGIDGSGKTTIIDEHSSTLTAEGRNVHIVWLRYNHYLSKSVLALARLFKFTVFEDHDDCRVSYHEFYRSKMLSHVFIWLTWLDAALTTLVLVYIPSRVFNYVVVCDRWVLDILIDLEIDTHIKLHRNSRYSRMFWGLVPSDAQLTVINRSYDDILDARPEHRYDRNLAERYRLYGVLMEYNDLIVIDNTADLESTHSQVKSAL